MENRTEKTREGKQQNKKKGILIIKGLKRFLINTYSFRMSQWTTSSLHLNRNDCFILEKRAGCGYQNEPHSHPIYHVPDVFICV